MSELNDRNKIAKIQYSFINTIYHANYWKGPSVGTKLHVHKYQKDSFPGGQKYLTRDVQNKVYFSD